LLVVENKTTANGREYVYAKINVAGTEISLVCFHDNAGAEQVDIDKRIADNTEIANLYKDDGYVIIAGDTNAYSNEELAPFANAGYTLGNRGFFGNINTYAVTIEQYIDNIIVKGFQQNTFEALPEQSATSDHIPVVSDINVIF
jgi:endonuclease/exonuclease/phosphatase family metal-dependent hydrolase